MVARDGREGEGEVNGVVEVSKGIMLCSGRDGITT